MNQMAASFSAQSYSPSFPDRQNRRGALGARERKIEVGRISKSTLARGSGSKLRKTSHRSRKEEDERLWISSSLDLSNHKDRFVIVSYNILADDNVSKHGELYEGMDPKVLDWTTRKRKLCKELRRYNPSILCLQEVDKFEDLTVRLRKDGFTGIYKGRTGEACDGCAIFWKEKQFALLQQEHLEYQKFGMRHNVAQLCVLKMHPKRRQSSSLAKLSSPIEEIKCGRTVIICNIHVLFNPNRGDIKLGQYLQDVHPSILVTGPSRVLSTPAACDDVSMVGALVKMRLLLEKAQLLSQEWNNAPVVIAGDFNSMPKSAIYQFLSCSELDVLLYNRRELSLQNKYPESPTVNSHFENRQRYPYSISSTKYAWSKQEILLAVGRKSGTNLQHSLNLSSVYSGIRGKLNTRDHCGEPLATSYHSKFMGTVDYIWHSDELVPVRVLDTLPVNILKKTGGLPSQKWGSDHLALVCELAFLNDANSSGNSVSSY